MCEWLLDFLSGRSQRVVLEGASSDLEPVVTGVPQGNFIMSRTQDKIGVSQENSQLLKKMTVTGMNLRDLNVLLLHYPFMSNPRYCLGCATQKIDLHSFIFLQLLFLCPVHNPFLPILRQPAGKAQLSPFSTKMYPACEGSIIPLMCLESKMISAFTLSHNKWG